MLARSSQPAPLHIPLSGRILRDTRTGKAHDGPEFGLLIHDGRRPSLPGTGWPLRTVWPGASRRQPLGCDVCPTLPHPTRKCEGRHVIRPPMNDEGRNDDLAQAGGGVVGDGRPALELPRPSGLSLAGHWETPQERKESRLLVVAAAWRLWQPLEMVAWSAQSGEQPDRHFNHWGPEGWRSLPTSELSMRCLGGGAAETPRRASPSPRHEPPRHVGGRRARRHCSDPPQVEGSAASTSASKGGRRETGPRGLSFGAGSLGGRPPGSVSRRPGYHSAARGRGRNQVCSPAAAHSSACSVLRKYAFHVISGDWWPMHTDTSWISLVRANSHVAK